MRSVIVAEIYCKALRRRDMSGKIAAAMPNPGAEADAGLAPPMLEDAAEGEKNANVDINITNLVGVDAFFIGELREAVRGERNFIATKILFFFKLQRKLQRTCTTS